MASKNLAFTPFLLLAVISAPLAEAQLLGLGQLLVNGTVHCSVGAVTASTAVFPNASVQLKCGNNVVATTTTDSSGTFSIASNFITSLLSQLLTSCKLVVTTPLSTSDASLPATGLLQSALQLLNGGGLVGGLLGIVTNLIPSGFNLVQ